MAVRQVLGGSWTTGWSFLYEELKEPELADDCIKLEPKRPKKGFLGFRGSAGMGLKLTDEAVRRNVAAKLKQAYDQI